MSFPITANKYEHLWFTIGNNQICECSSEKILGANIESKLNFDIHLESIVKLTALVRTSNILALPKLKVLIKWFFESQFSYCPLVWMFCGRTLQHSATVGTVGTVFLSSINSSPSSPPVTDHLLQPSPSTPTPHLQKRKTQAVTG